MVKVGLAVNFRSKFARKLLEKTISYLNNHNLDFCVEGETTLVELDDGIEVVSSLNPAEQDFFITIGGDGTIIKTARDIGDAHLISIRLPKSRGFLAEIDARKSWKSIEKNLDAYLAGDYYIVTAPRLKITTHQDIQIPSVLNEYLLTCSEAFKVVNFSIKMDSEESEIACSSDGLIIATAAGSTGHALSCGGSIIHYGLSIMEFCPINPLYYTSRPIIVPDDEKIEIIAETKSDRLDRKIKLIIDGQLERIFDTPFEFRISKAPNATNFVRFRSFLSRVSRTRMWR